MKNKKQKNQEQKPQQLSNGISQRGKKVIFSGIFVLILGYFILTKTDPAGQNWASVLSPFLIVGGYVAVGIGILVPDKKASVE